MGWHLQRTGHVLVDRSKPGAGIMKKMAWLVRQRHSLILFPEGTRSTDGQVGALQGRVVSDRARGRAAGGADQHPEQPSRDVPRPADGVPRPRHRHRPRADRYGGGAAGGRPRVLRPRPRRRRQRRGVTPRTPRPGVRAALVTNPGVRSAASVNPALAIMPKRAANQAQAAVRPTVRHRDFSPARRQPARRGSLGLRDGLPRSIRLRRHPGRRREPKPRCALAARAVGRRAAGLDAVGTAGAQLHARVESRDRRARRHRLSRAQPRRASHGRPGALRRRPPDAVVGSSPRVVRSRRVAARVRRRAPLDRASAEHRSGDLRRPARREPRGAVPAADPLLFDPRMDLGRRRRVRARDGQQGNDDRRAGARRLVGPRVPG